MPIPEFLGALQRKVDPCDYPLGAVSVPVARPPQYLPDISWFKRNYQGQTAFCGPHAGTHLKAILDFVTLAGAPGSGRKNPRYGAIKLKDPNSLYDGFPIDAGTDMRDFIRLLTVELH